MSVHNTDCLYRTEACDDPSVARSLARSLARSSKPASQIGTRDPEVSKKQKATKGPSLRVLLTSHVAP